MSRRRSNPVRSHPEWLADSLPAHTHPFQKVVQIHKKIHWKLLGMCCVVLGVAFYGFVKSQSVSTVSTQGELSLRSRSFLERQRENPQDSLLDQESTTGVVNPVGTTLKTYCAWFISPYRTMNVRPEGDEKQCKLTVSITSPRSLMNLNVRTLTTKPEEDTGFMLRDRLPSTYTLQPVQYDGYPWSKTYTSSDGLNIFLTKNGKLVTLSITPFLLPKNNDWTIVQSMIDSLRVY